MLDSIAATGAIDDEHDFDAKVKAFADGFVPTDMSGEAPEASDPGALASDLVDSEITLPEEEIRSVEEG